MIFTAESVERIVAGTKWMTRRIAKPYHIGFPLDANAKVCVMSWGGDGRSFTHWSVGKTYSVQPGRGQKAVGRILVTAITFCEAAEIISDADVRAEGFEGRAAFLEAYQRLNGRSALYAPCWCLAFRLVEGER